MCFYIAYQGGQWQINGMESPIKLVKILTNIIYLVIIEKGDPIEGH